MLLLYLYLPNNVVLFADCTEQSDVVFALEVSKKVTQKTFKKVVDFAKNVVLNLPVDSSIRVGLETYSTGETVSLMGRLLHSM